MKLRQSFMSRHQLISQSLASIQHFFQSFVQVLQVLVDLDVIPAFGLQLLMVGMCWRGAQIWILQILIQAHVLLLSRGSKWTLSLLLRWSIVLILLWLWHWHTQLLLLVKMLKWILKLLVHHGVSIVHLLLKMLLLLLLVPYPYRISVSKLAQCRILLLKRRLRRKHNDWLEDLREFLLRLVLKLYWSGVRWRVI